MKRYKIIYKRPEITLNDANAMADFDRLLHAHNLRNKGNSGARKISGAIALAIILVGLILYVNRTNFFSIEKSAPNSPEKENFVTDQRQANEPASNLMETEEPYENNTFEKEESMPIDASQKNTSTPTNHTEKPSQKEPTGYVEAKPIDGFCALYLYFDKNLVYPTEIIDEGIEGSVIVKFVIDEDGFPQKITIEKSLHYKLDSTALSLIRVMPKWSPASLDDKPIPSTHRIPLYFQINEPAE